MKDGPPLLFREGRGGGGSIMEVGLHHVESQSTVPGRMGNGMAFSKDDDIIEVPFRGPLGPRWEGAFDKEGSG